MAEITLGQSGTANATMQLKIYYESGNGNITITGLAGARDSYGPTDSHSNSETIYLKIAGQTFTLTPSYGGSRAISFGKNYSFHTFWSGSQSKACEGNQTIEVTFSSVNSNIYNSKFVGQINAGYSNPSISVNTYSTSNRLIFSYDTSATFTVKISNMQGRTGNLYYRNVSGQDILVDTINADNNNKSITIPSTTVNDFITGITNTAEFSFKVRIVIGNLAGEADVYVRMDPTIAPTLGIYINSTLSNYPSLVNKKVQQLTRPVITFTGQGKYGSTITSYSLTGITNYSSDNFPKSITAQSATYTCQNPFQGSGATWVYADCYDTRSRKNYLPTMSQQYDVIAYSNPIFEVEAQRCLDDGTLDNEGTYIKISGSYNVSPINDGTNNLNTFIIEYSYDEGVNWHTLVSHQDSGFQWSDQFVSGPIHNGNNDFEISRSYNIYIRATDIANTINRTKVIDISYTLVSRHNGGKGITFGKIATQDDFHCYLDAYFHGTVYGLLDSLWPVGAVYISTTQITATKDTVGKNGCPLAELGGTWERIKSRFLLGTGSIDANTTNWCGTTTAGSYNFGSNSTGEMGGAATHTHGLTSGYAQATYTWIDNQNRIMMNYKTTSAWTANRYTTTGAPTYAEGAWGGINNSISLGGNADSNYNLPPYYTVFMWRRTA